MTLAYRRITPEWMASQFLLIFFMMIVFAGCNDKNEALLQEQQLRKILNDKFTGDLAYETTDFVEDFWRVSGNSGFNASISRLVEHLEKSGFVNEEQAGESGRFTYRLEKRPMELPTWEPVDARLSIEGEPKPLLDYATNRNMIVLNSHSTPKGGIRGELVAVNSVEDIKESSVKGKIVFAELNPAFLVAKAKQHGAIGLITYNNPAYLQPEKNQTSIQFRSIPMDTVNKIWAIALSYETKEQLKNKLKEGGVVINVKIETKIYSSEELTLIADIKGSEFPDERLVFSAHVQEPGANDNASGVGVALEMATLTAGLINDEAFDSKRTISFLWGDEIISTRRYVADKELRKTVKWGISLDMVGENTAITGGSFLIEKMPDPSAIWTRGNDKHSEWGGSPLKLDQLKPHYLNDFVLKRFKKQGERANWEVNTNPFEGGSDHVPFLRADIPSVLFWHFTDQFYHTDNDRIDKVSRSTLKNVGIASLDCAFTLLNGEEETAGQIIDELKEAGQIRIMEELKQGKLAMENGENKAKQIEIIRAWEEWYLKAIETTTDLVKDQTTIEKAILSAKSELTNIANQAIESLQ